MAYGREPVYDEEGFDDFGYDREGYTKDEYDSDGYNKAGIDQWGFDRSGFDKDGFDMEGKHMKESFPDYYQEEKGIFTSGFKGAGHIWEEIEKYFPNIDSEKKRKIIVGKNQKGEITVGLNNAKSRTFKLFTAASGDELVVNNTLPPTIKKILGIPEEKRTYKYRKNVKNEEIENLKKEIQRLKIKHENEIENFLRYKKEVERWGEDKSRENEQMRLKQIDDMEKLDIENKKQMEEMKQLEQLKNRQIEEMQQWATLRISKIEEMKNKEKINEEEKKRMGRIIFGTIEQRKEEIEQIKKNDESMKRGMVKLKEKNERIEIVKKEQKEKIENLKKEINGLEKEKKKEKDEKILLIKKKNDEIASLNDDKNNLEEKQKEDVRKMEELKKENSLLESQIDELKQEKTKSSDGYYDLLNKKLDEKNKNDQKINELKKQIVTANVEVDAANLEKDELLNEIKILRTNIIEIQSDFDIEIANMVREKNNLETKLEELDKEKEMLYKTNSENNKKLLLMRSKNFELTKEKNEERVKMEELIRDKEKEIRKLTIAKDLGITMSGRDVEEAAGKINELREEIRILRQK